MSNQATIDSLNIKIATVEAQISNWEDEKIEALNTGNMVGGRRAANEARLAHDELFELKRQLAKLELGY